MFRQKDLAFSQINFYCNGSTAAVLSNRSCTIPMTVFRQPNFNLDFKDLIVAKVKATNVIGDGLFSDENISGVLI